MATLKEHQAAMVDLLANGSGIPASASRLAHAMHDLIAAHLAVGDITFEFVTNPLTGQITKRDDATTPGLNDKALSRREKALKTDSPAKWPTPAENRVKELENTIRQLKAQNAKQRKDIAFLKMERNNAVAQLPEQAGCRKEDTQVCEHKLHDAICIDGSWIFKCHYCGLDVTESISAEGQSASGVEGCNHKWYFMSANPLQKQKQCILCGRAELDK